jgi:hypothetical protein
MLELKSADQPADADVPDAKANLMAAQLGTLCNTIYGSGTATPSFVGLD